MQEDIEPEVEDVDLDDTDLDPTQLSNRDDSDILDISGRSGKLTTFCSSVQHLRSFLVRPKLIGFFQQSGIITSNAIGIRSNERVFR